MCVYIYVIRYYLLVFIYSIANCVYNIYQYFITSNEIIDIDLPRVQWSTKCKYHWTLGIIVIIIGIKVKIK